MCAKISSIQSDMKSIIFSLPSLHAESRLQYALFEVLKTSFSLSISRLLMTFYWEMKKESKATAIAQFTILQLCRTGQICRYKYEKKTLIWLNMSARVCAKNPVLLIKKMFYRRTRIICNNYLFSWKCARICSSYIMPLTFLLTSSPLSRINARDLILYFS
jgi:hypothetical protein